MSLDVAWSVPKSQLAVSTVAGRGPGSLGVCLCWLPDWLPEIWLASLMASITVQTIPNETYKPAERRRVRSVMPGRGAATVVQLKRADTPGSARHPEEPD